MKNIHQSVHIPQKAKIALCFSSLVRAPEETEQIMKAKSRAIGYQN